MGYINGSDMLVKLGSGCIGHCTSHETTYNTETKETAVKPLATAMANTASLFKNKRITGLSVQISFEGLKLYGETESGFKEALGKWRLGQSVAVTAFQREKDNTPYLSGNFVITNLKESNPAGDDATYSGTLENDGAVTVDETKIDPAVSGGSGNQQVQ